MDFAEFEAVLDPAIRNAALSTTGYEVAPVGATYLVEATKM
jgi:hypothetical protein